MSDVRRTIVIAGVLGTVLAVPTVAGAEPNVPDENIARSVYDLKTNVLDIKTDEAVLPLEEEEDNGQQVTVRISADVLFDFNRATPVDFNRATLTETARRRIAALADRLRGVSGTVTVSGHTDSIGADDYNLDLSERRAQAVKTELERALQGAPLQIEAKGYGETRPVAPNEQGGKDNPEGRAKNRRVDITYEKE